MAVARTDKLSQAKFDALAGIANSKAIDGKPYRFLSTGGWKTELERLRANLFKAISNKFYVGGNPPDDPANPTNIGVWISDEVLNYGPYPLPTDAYVSGEWPIQKTNSNTVTPNYISPMHVIWRKSVYEIENSTIVPGTDNEYITTTPKARGISYIFPSSEAIPATKLIYRLQTGYVPVKMNQITDKTVTFQLNIKSPVEGRLYGKLYLSPRTATPLTISGPNTGDFTVDFVGGYTSIECDFYTKGNVEITLTSSESLPTPDGSASFYSFYGTSSMFFDVEFSDAYEVGGIHPTQNVYRIDTEAPDYLDGIGISTGDDDDLLSGSGSTVISGIPVQNGFVIGNYWESLVTASDNSHGIFVGKTPPISKADFYQNVETLEPTRNLKSPFAKFETASGLTVIPVKPAIFDTIPRFAVQRSTDSPISDLRSNEQYLDPGDTNYRGEYVRLNDYQANDSIHYSAIGAAAGYYYAPTEIINSGVTPSPVPGAVGSKWIKFAMAKTYDARVQYGSIIRDVYVRRQPTKQGEFYLPDPDCAELDVELGCIRNGVFVSFQTVTIPAGQHGVRIFPFWPVFDTWNVFGLCAKKLIYRCDEMIDVQASLMMPQPTFGPECRPPKLADFYNDTEAMLALL